MLFPRQDQMCDQGIVDPYCSPSPNDIWNNNTSHLFIWNPSYPFYSSSETIDLYLYYKENLQFMPIKNWTALPCSTGSLAVQVDDSWFPYPLNNQSQKQWTMYGFYLPSFINPTQELSNPDSQYPRPFNFSVMQFGKSQIGNNYNNATTTTTTTTTAGQKDPSKSLSQSNDMVHAFPIWAIIVLAITSATLFLMLMLTSLWFLYRRSPKNDKEEETNTITDTTVNNKVIDQDRSAPSPSSSPLPGPLSGRALNEPSNNSDPSPPPLTRTATTTTTTASPSSNHRHSDASWQRRSSLLSSSNAAILEETVQRMMDSPDWDDHEERRRQLGDQLLRKELEADQETMVKDTIASHKPQINSLSKENNDVL